MCLWGRIECSYATGGYHAENVQAMFPLAGNEYVLPVEMPAVRHIFACADMAFVSEAQVDVSLMPEIYKFSQLEGLYLNQLRQGNSPWAFSYTLISCAIVFFYSNMITLGVVHKVCH